MPDFAYTAIDPVGKRTQGTISASTEREAIATLSGQELFPVEINQQQAARAIRWRRRPSPQHTAILYGQLAGLLRSGVPLLRSLDVLRKQSSSPALAEILAEVHDRVEDGESLADALKRFPDTFGDMATSILRAGSEGGFIEDALEHVASFTEMQQDLKARTVGALIYPLLLAVIGFVIVTCILIFLVPMFEPLFARLKEINEMPLLTEWLLATSAWLQAWWLPLLLAAGAGYWFIRNRLKTPEGRALMDRLKLQLPLVGPILRQLAVARFCRVLGTLLHNGVPIVRSLTISAEATGNRLLADAIGQAAENITAGQSLSRPLAASGQFPPVVVEMVSVAEESNTLEKVLTDIAQSLDRATWRRLELAVRLIEPLMLVIMAGAVLVIVLALVLPMMKMSMGI